MDHAGQRQQRLLGTPSSFAGPDTNSTALAIEGLAAQGALTAAVSTGAQLFLTTGQDADGGWSFYPNTVARPGPPTPTRRRW